MKKTTGKIGNIVTQGTGKGHPKIFNICKNMGGIDPSLPTLIIGLQESKAILGKNFSIIERRPKERVWWTYKKVERNSEYESDIEDFYRHCLLTILGKIQYRYVNFPRYRYSKLKSFITYMRNHKKKVCFITRDRNFVFVYVPSDSIVLGLSLNLLEYCGIPKDKSLKRLKSNRYNTFMKDTAFIDSTIRSIIGNDTHYIPVLSHLFSEN
ncbi:MAG: hypothetical protein J6X18_17745 [Bacteroidales bacterium]|nr:hypothetical protein [Bacteroidales bacterium]